MKFKRLVTAIEDRTGRRPALSTALRWCQKGCRGIRLESWMVGGVRCTTDEAVDRFVQQLTAQTTQASQPPISCPDSSRVEEIKRASRLAERELA